MHENGPWYYIKSMLTGLVLDVQGAEHGANIIIYEAGGGDNQLWTLNGNEIVSKTGYALDVQGGSTDSGTNAIAWEHSPGAENQQWRIEGDKIISTLTGFALDICGGNTESGTEVILYPFSHGEINNQSWKLVPFEG